MASLRTHPSSPATLLFRRPSFRPKSRSRISLSLPGDCSSPSSASPGLVDAAGLKRASPGALGQSDLLIVGPGVLGRIVAEKWQKEHLGCQILGQTMTFDHHDELIKLGIIPSLRGSEHNYKFPYVIFCAPPSRTSDYPGDVRLAASNWSGEGCFLLTSSSALYDCNDNGFCNEDAASLAVTIMKKKLRGQIFLGCDNHPVSRQEIMDYVNRSGKFSKKFAKFIASEGPLGKRMNNSKTRAALGWEPKFSSFPVFLGLSV
ncbi:uncharacterized protein LOC122041798 isoform X2 [Zingiber officinale]|uniref:uncharacterized protein LOC122041798 isoform X2 n=1 Tax=Zingiber officinale TaxID=94328 RepID=UPI001C4D7144|nr:uncharacterized protein LOC122041798 isoform X2 [Zingiber officinale]